MPDPRTGAGIIGSHPFPRPTGALELLTASAPVAAEEVVVLGTADALALTGVAQLMTSIAHVTQRLNPRCRHPA